MFDNLTRSGTVNIESFICIRDRDNGQEYLVTLICPQFSSDIRNSIDHSANFISTMNNISMLRTVPLFQMIFKVPPAAFQKLDLPMSVSSKRVYIETGVFMN